MHTTRLLRLAIAALLALPAAGLAQTATIYGSLGNFDVNNHTGHPAHGFEIELEGLSPGDVYYTFRGTRYGVPEIVPGPNGTGAVVRWKSAYLNGAYNQTTVARTSTTTFAGACYIGNISYNSAGCEHFGVTLRASAARASYYWLVDDPNNPGTLVRAGLPSPIATPVYYVAPPVVGVPPVVVAEVEAPEAPEPPEVETPERYGNATWVKLFIQQYPREVSLDELLTDNPLVVPMDPGQLEVDWDLMQEEPASGTNSNGNQRRNRGQHSVNLEPTTRAIVRRIEVYRYTGAYDPTTHEALCADGGLCDAPLDGELGAFESANMTAVLVQPDSVNITKVGNGKVESSDRVLSCGSKCVSPYVGGTVVTLTAQAGSGSVFAGWTGACSAFGTAPTCTVTVQGIVGVTATFATAPATGGGGGGGATGGGGGGGGASNVQLSVKAAGGKGLIVGQPGTINCGKVCSATFAPGTAVTLTATPEPGFQFVNWTGGCTGTATACTVTVRNATTVQANFIRP